MKRSLLALFVALTVSLGLSAPASAANPHASCSGLAASSLAGQPGARALVIHNAFAEAEEHGITFGALNSEFSRFHDGSAEACLG
jgi:hypothetical protein